MNTIEAQQAASMEVPDRIQVRSMYCSCCGGRCGRWLQWHNRDTGYGVCTSCVAKIEQRNLTAREPIDIERTYGVRGVNWGDAPID